MRLNKRLTKEVTKLGIIFLIVITIITVLFLQINSALKETIDESGPTVEVLNHFIVNAYQGHRSLYKYLDIKEYTDAVKLDQIFEKNEETCEGIENDFENLVLTKRVSDIDLINGYNTTYIMYNDMEAVLNEVLELHKQELATYVDLNTEKQTLLDQYSLLFERTVNNILNQLDSIGEKNKILRDKLILQSKLYFIAVLVLIIIFIFLLLRKIREISTQVIKPIDDAIEKTQSFVDGDYSIRMRPTTKISELADLQYNINSVFSVVAETIKGNPEEKGKIESLLLRKECVDVLGVLKKNMLHKKQTTISELKKELGVTHPTILSRLKVLELKSFITITKEGREKIISLTGKGDLF